MNRNEGFTLIELIIVIVLLGILAVSALPRFVDLSSDAQISANEAVASVFETAVNTAHLKWIVSGSPGRVQNLPNLSDGILDFSTNGWPIGIDKGSDNDNVGQFDKGCFEIWNYLIVSGPRASDTTNTEYESFRHSGDLQCSYVLRSNGDSSDRSNTQLGIIYNSANGEVATCGQLIGKTC